MLPYSRNTDYAGGMPILADDLDALQDSVVSGAHGPQELPLDLSRRIISSGTWTVGSGLQLTESTSGVVCFVPIMVPVGHLITGVRLRGIQTGASDQFSATLNGATGNASGNPIGSTTPSNSAIVGTEQDVNVVVSHTTGANTRYFVRVATLGGGAGNRIITGAFVTTVKAP
jgi:hypothetical protein